MSPWRIPGIPGPSNPPRIGPPTPIPRVDEHPTSRTIQYPPEAGPAPYVHGRSGSNEECGDGQSQPSGPSFFPNSPGAPWHVWRTGRSGFPNLRGEMMSHSWLGTASGLRSGGSTLVRAHATQHMSSRKPSCHSGPARHSVTRPNQPNGACCRARPD